MRGAVAALTLATALVGPRGATAQQPPMARAAPEVRIDLIAGHEPAVQLGAGVQIAAGYYARVGLDAALGVPFGSDAAAGLPRHGIDGRLDLLARFLLDPFRQTAYGVSVGGGASLRAEQGDRSRPFLLVALDVEGRRSTKGVVPALQLGLGGGMRIGVVLRRAAVGAR